MIARLATEWLIMAVAVVSILSFMFGMLLDALISDDGFGPVGNMFVLTAGFFIAIVAANWQGYTFRDLTFATMVGLGGAFACFAVLAIMKAALARL